MEGPSDPDYLNKMFAQPMPHVKEWHADVPLAHRKNFVSKIVQEMIPSPDSQAMLDQRMHNLVAYAKKVESDMFGMANSRVSILI